MKKLILLAISSLIVNCKTGKEEVILPNSNGKDNQLLVVVKNEQWEKGPIGKAFRQVFGEHLVGLPQPEIPFSISQLNEGALNRMMRVNRNILVIEDGKEAKFLAKKDVYAAPQTVMYVSG